MDMDSLKEAPKRNIRYSKLKQWVALLLEFLFVPATWVCRRSKNEECVRKILLIEPFMLGDAAFLSVMIAPLKSRFPEAEIHLLIQPKCAALYADDERVDKIHAYHMPWVARRGESGNRWLQFFQAVWRLRCEKIDMAIDVRGEVRSQIVMALAGIPRRVGFVNYLCSNMVIKGRLLTENAGLLPLQHRIHTCLDLCEYLGCEVDRQKWLPHAAQRKIPVPERILIHTGGGGKFKCWPSDRWAALLNLIHEYIDTEVVLVGMESEHAQNRKIAEMTHFDPEVKTTSLVELQKEIEESDLLICLDSAPLHLAVLRMKPVLALFGAGVIWLYRPISPGSRIVHHQDRFECAPCAGDVCGKDLEAACMLSITVDDVFTVLRTSLKVVERR